MIMADAILNISRLTKMFGGIVAVNDLSLEVEKGTITSIIGPNGAGKTTFFNLVTGVFPPTSGEIRFDGVPLSGKRAHDIARLGVARTFQNVQVFPDMSAIENVMMGRHLSSSAGFFRAAAVPSFFRKEEKQVLRAAAKWLSFVGLEEMAKVPAGRLPLGSQRLLELARALAMEPLLLLLDEPASGLNSRETFTMGNMISKVKESGVTVVLVEHDMELVMDISDAVHVINFGHRLASGTPAEVQANPEVIRAYLGQ